MVYGSDLCEMLGLFHDIAEAIGLFNEQKIAALEKFKIAYENRMRREKRKEREQQEEEKKRNEIEDEQMQAVRKHNTELLMRTGDLQQ